MDERVTLESLIYKGKEYSVGPRFSKSQIKSKALMRTKVEPKAVNLLVIYAQDYFRVYHSVMHTFEHYKRLIESSSIYNSLISGVYRKLPRKVTKRIDRINIKEYRMDGDMIGNSIDLKIDEIDYRRKTQRPAELDPKVLHKIMTRYVFEMMRYRNAEIEAKHISKAVRPWVKQLKLSPEAASILEARVSKHLKFYKTKEQPLVGVFFARYLKTGAVRTIGERYKRNPIPLLDIGDILWPAIDFLVDLTQYGPKESGIENPEEIAIFMPRSVAAAPILGSRVKVHHLRHALYYSCFYELLTPESPIYNDYCNNPNKVYETMMHLIKSDRLYEEKKPNFISEIYFRDQSIQDLIRGKALSDPFQKSIIATALYLKENLNGHAFREALTHTWGSHLAFLGAPWLFYLMSMGIGTIFVPPIINALTISHGHGNLLAYGKIKEKIKKCHDPFEELFTLATLGN